MIDYSIIGDFDHLFFFVFGEGVSPPRRNFCERAGFGFSVGFPLRLRGTYIARAVREGYNIVEVHEVERLHRTCATRQVVAVWIPAAWGMGSRRLWTQSKARRGQNPVSARTQSVGLGTWWVPDEAPVGLQSADVSPHDAVDLPRDPHLDAVPLP